MTPKTILDVRTDAEFLRGHVPGSYNIPLQELVQRLDEVRSLPPPITLCCASGMRSGQAAVYLKSVGIACENGGSWLELKSKLQNHVSIS